MEFSHLAVCNYCQIAIFNTELSVQNFKAAMEVPAALGLDPTVANSGKREKQMPLVSVRV